MSDRLPASFALDESSRELLAARCVLIPLLRLDRARSIHTLTAEHGRQESLPPSNLAGGKTKAAGIGRG